VPAEIAPSWGNFGLRWTNFILRVYKELVRYFLVIYFVNKYDKQGIEIVLISSQLLSQLFWEQIHQGHQFITIQLFLYKYTIFVPTNHF